MDTETSKTLYTQLIGFEEDGFHVKAAHNMDEACSLVEAGFEYVCDSQENKPFRKRR